MLYALQAGEDDGPIKFGYTARMPTRPSELQTGNHEELHLIAACQGTKRDETSLKCRFRAEAGIRGEWFRPVPALLQTIGNWLPGMDWDGRYARKVPLEPYDDPFTLAVDYAYDRLGELAEEINFLLDEDRLTLAHCRALLWCEGDDVRVRLAKRAVAGGWSFRRLEEAARATRDAVVRPFVASPLQLVRIRAGAPGPRDYGRPRNWGAHDHA